jgi:hypothetical protein
LVVVFVMVRVTEAGGEAKEEEMVVVLVVMVVVITGEKGEESRGKGTIDDKGNRGGEVVGCITARCDDTGDGGNDKDDDDDDDDEEEKGDGVSGCASMWSCAERLSAVCCLLSVGCCLLPTASSLL